MGVSAEFGLCSSAFGADSGGLDGFTDKRDCKKLNIPKDSTLGADGQPYFLITGVLDNIDFMDKRNKNTISLVPGMTATVRIKVRTEPLYLYLLKQILS